jgi:hypothetical protein
MLAEYQQPATTDGLTIIAIFRVPFLLQPVVYENPALAAYSPPPGTLVIPLPRNSAELADLPYCRQHPP